MTMEEYQVSRGRVFLQFFCLCVGSSIVYHVPYNMAGYLDLILVGLRINNTQWGLMRGAFSTTALITYLPGGWVADRFSARKLLALSMAANGVLSLWFVTFPSYGICVMLFVLMGIFSTLTFWSALIKCTRQFSRGLGEGKAFGGLEGGRSLVGLGFGTVMTAVFAALGGDMLALRINVIVYAMLQLVVGVLVLIAFREEQIEAGAKGDNFAIIVECLKHPGVWMITLIVFGVYTSSLSSSYLNPYFTRVLGTSMVFAVAMNTVRGYFRPLGAFAGGF